MESHRLYSVYAIRIHSVVRPVEADQSLVHCELVQLYFGVGYCFPDLVLL